MTSVWSGAGVCTGVGVAVLVGEPVLVGVDVAVAVPVGVCVGVGEIPVQAKGAVARLRGTGSVTTSKLSKLLLVSRHPLILRTPPFVLSNAMPLFTEGLPPSPTFTAPFPQLRRQPSQRYSRVESHRMVSQRIHRY